MDVQASMFSMILCDGIFDDYVQVLGTVKNAALVIFCVIFLGEQVTLLQGLGYFISLAGFTWYQMVKLSGRPSANEPGTSKQEHCSSDVEIVKLGSMGPLDRLFEWVGRYSEFRGK